MNTYDKVMKLLTVENEDINFSEKEHVDEGYGMNVAMIHGVQEKYGAKALVLKMQYAAAGKNPAFCLAVLSFTHKIDTDYVKTHFNAKKVSFASWEESEQITQCMPGAIPPFSFKQTFPVLIDEKMQEVPQLFFNAGRLDRSICMKTADYFRIAKKKKFVITKLS